MPSPRSKTAAAAAARGRRPLEQQRGRQATQEQGRRNSARTTPFSPHAGRRGTPVYDAAELLAGAGSYLEGYGGPAGEAAAGLPGSGPLDDLLGQVDRLLSQMEKL